MYSRLIDITRKLKLAANINGSDHVGSIRDTHKTNSTQETAREVCQQLNSKAQTTPAKRIHLSHHLSTDHQQSSMSSETRVFAQRARRRHSYLTASAVSSAAGCSPASCVSAICKSQQQHNRRNQAPRKATTDALTRHPGQATQKSQQLISAGASTIHHRC